MGYLTTINPLISIDGVSLPEGIPFRSMSKRWAIGWLLAIFKRECLMGLQLKMGVDLKMV